MARHVVAALAADPVPPFELAVAAEVFGFDRPELGVPWYDFRVCSATPGPIGTKAGFTIQACDGLETLAAADTVVVPGWQVGTQPPEEILGAIRAAHRRGARMMSVCSGAFVLAAAGLLDGRPATTHWMYAERLAAEYPAVKVDPRVLYIDDGDVLTSAGTAAGIDLCLHVVRLDHGAEIANAVARRMVVPPHRDGGQAQYVDRPVPATDSDSPLHETLGWMLEHLDEELTVTQLARRAHLSPRTFARRFRTVTGTTPHRWLLDQRLLLAQRLLETTDVPVERIATNAGFGAPATLRHHFQRWAGTSPLAYRRTFRGLSSLSGSGTA